MDSHTATMLTVGERLKIARERARYRAGQMAQDLGRHRNMVTTYEASNDVPMRVIRTYAERLPNDTTIEWLTAEVGPAPRDLRVSGRVFGCIYEALSLFDTPDVGDLAFRGQRGKFGTPVASTHPPVVDDEGRRAA